MSTVTERIMRERGDCEVFHEPFLVYYYLHLAAAQMPMLDQALVEPRDYHSIRQQLLKAGQCQAVFFKDMSYFVAPRIFADSVFCRRLHNVFLIRDPRKSIVSYFKLDNKVTQTEIGLDAQWQHYQFLRDKLGIKPLVLNAETIAQDPHTQIRRLWQYAGLPAIETAFNWQCNTEPPAWQYVRGWHQRALSTDRIVPDNRDAQALFDNAVSHSPHLQKYLEYHWPYYLKLKRIANAQARATS